MKNGITMIPFGLGKKEMKITAGSDKTFVKFSCFVADLLKLWYSEAILSKYIQKNLKKYGRSGQNVQEEYKRWLAADLEDADLNPELSRIEGNDEESKIVSQWL